MRFSEICTKKTLFIAFPVLLVLTFFTLCVLLLIISLFRLKSPSIPLNSQTNHYKFTEINTFDNLTSFGFTQNPQFLEQEEYLAYRNPDSNSLFVVSNFGGKNYECRGSCSCDFGSIHKKRKSNRRSAVGMSRGIFVLLSAFSTAMAIEIAKDSFVHHCARKYWSTETDEEREERWQTPMTDEYDLDAYDLPEFSDSEFYDEIDNDELDKWCDGDVDACWEKDKDFYEGKMSEGEPEELRKSNQEFDCKGYCIKNKHFKRFFGTTHDKIGKGKIGDCREMTTSHHFDSKEVREIEEVFQSVKDWFASTYLDDFCRQTSTMFFDRNKVLNGALEQPSDLNPDELSFSNEVRVEGYPYCTGTEDTFYMDKTVPVTNIECVGVKIKRKWGYHD